jgi:hypothetical protein
LSDDGGIDPGTGGGDDGGGTGERLDLGGGHGDMGDACPDGDGSIGGVPAGEFSARGSSSRATGRAPGFRIPRERRSICTVTWR